mgnify:CR=1 FL=1
MEGAGYAGKFFDRGIIDRATCACGHGTCAENRKRQRRKWQNWEQEYHLILWIRCICWMRSQILEIYFMEIEYKRELTKSYMCVKTDQDFLPFEKEILTRSSILGIVPVNTTFADAATVCWYDITGMQAFDHALEMEMMDSQMLTQFLVSLCGTLERLESFLLDPGHLWFSQESIFKNNRDGSFWFCYCPEGKENITEGFQKLMEYLLTKIDHKDQRAVKMAYHIYDQVIKEGYSLIAIRESLTYDRVDIEPVPDRTLENSRVELEQTSNQTEKEKNVHKADKADGKAKVIFQKAIEHFFPDLAKIKEYRQELAKKKEKKNEIQPIVFEPEEEEVRMGRPTVLLADQKKTIQGILRYEGNNQLSDLKIDTFPYVIGSAADCPGYVDCATISRHHAKITKVENVYFIEDMNSANGTKAGGTLLDYKMKVSLQANEILEFADEKFRFI